MNRSLVALAAALAALAVTAPAGAQVVAPGVTVAGVDVGGMTGPEVTAALTSFFNQRLSLRIGRTALTPAPAKLGAKPRIPLARSQALAAAPGTALELGVLITSRRLKGWIAARAARFDRAPVNARARLVRGVPHLTSSKPGRALMRLKARQRLVSVLRAHRRDTVTLPVKTVRAAISPRKVGPVVLIRRGSKRLTLFRGTRPGPMSAVATFGVATGMAAYPTPLGSFRIVTKQRNPWWYPPSAGWAAGASPIPPGPGNPLGTRWMGLNVGSVGIHGTPDAASIGYSASHGCVRMHISNAEWLFERVRVGTPVFIVSW